MHIFYSLSYLLLVLINLMSVLTYKSKKIFTFIKKVLINRYRIFAYWYVYYDRYAARKVNDIFKPVLSQSEDYVVFFFFTREYTSQIIKNRSYSC